MHCCWCQKDSDAAADIRVRQSMTNVFVVVVLMMMTTTMTTTTTTKTMIITRKRIKNCFKHGVDDDNDQMKDGINEVDEIMTNNVNIFYK